MKANGNELNDDLLEEIQACSNEDRHDDLVYGVFPAPCRFVTIQVVVLHCREKGDFDRKPPEEQSCWHFKSLAEISPFLAVVGEETGYQTHGVRNGFRQKLASLDYVRIGVVIAYSSSPKSQPNNL